MVNVKPTTTIDTEYEYDDQGNVKKIHSVSTFDEPPAPCVTTAYTGSDEDDDECNLEYGLCVPSLAETLLAAAAGAIVGNVIYHLTKKLMTK